MSKNNKIKYNLKNVHIAIQTKNSDGTFSYATPVALPGAVSLSLEAQGEASPFYADGIVYFRAVNNNGYSGDLEIALITDWFRRNILKEIKDVNGVLIERNDDVEPVYFALLFEFDGDQKAIRHVMYNCTVGTRPTLASQTKEENIDPGTETLSISADPREDGLVKAKTGDNTTAEAYNAWYQSVYVPGAAAEDEEIFARLAVLTIGNLALTPAFAAGTATYTAETENDSDIITAVGAPGTEVAVAVNNAAHTNGAAAAWTAGNNTVSVTVTMADATTTVYTVTVTKGQAEG